jgi:hypothetical protein
MRVVLAVIGSVLLLAVALLALAPSNLIDHELASATDGRLRLVDSEGSVWRGSGSLLLPGDFRQPIAWQIDKSASAAAGELRGTLTVPPVPGQNVVPPPVGFEIGRGRVHVEGLSLALPADVVLRASGAVLPVSASGTLFVQLQRLDLADKSATVNGTADWRGASLAATGTELRLDLGDVQLSAAGSGTEIPGSIMNRGGDVALDGTIRWPVGRSVSGDITVTPRAGLEPGYASGLATALMMAGRPDGRGGYRISWAAPR